MTNFQADAVPAAEEGAAISAFYEQVTDWVKEREDWAVRRYTWPDGEADRLLIHTPRGRFMLSPFRDMPGHCFDLYMIPSLESVQILREADGSGWNWYEPDLDRDDVTPRPWSPEQLVAALDYLAEQT